MPGIFKKKIFWIGLVLLLIVVLGIYFNIQKSKLPAIEYITEQAKKTDLIQTVSATGTIVADSVIDLKFQTAGKLEKINYKKGDLVKAGDVLAELNSDSQKISVDSANAAYQLALANLNLKKAGATAETIKIAELNVDSAQVFLDSSKRNLEDTKKLSDQNISAAENDLKNAQISKDSAEVALKNAEKDFDNTGNIYDQAVTNSYANAKSSISASLVTISSSLTTMDNVLGIDNSIINDSFEKFLGAKDISSKTKAEDAYRTAKNSYVSVSNSYNLLPLDYKQSDIDALLISITSALNNAISAAGATRILLDNSVSAYGFSDETLLSYKTNVDSARTNLNTSLTNVQTSEQNITNAKLNKTYYSDQKNSSYDAAKANYDTALNNLSSAQSRYETLKIEWDEKIKSAEDNVSQKQTALNSANASLASTKASPRYVDLAPYEAQVSSAQAGLDSANNELNKTKLIASIDSILADINNEIGENIDTMSVFIKLISQELIFEADIAEADISKLKVENQVGITLDSSGDEKILPGFVFTIDPAETLIEKVTYYKCKIKFVENTELTLIKSGMTGDAEIKTAEKSNVLAVPQRAVLIKENKKYVRILEGNNVREVFVETGLLDSNGMIEILNNVSEGDNVVTFIKENK